MGNNKAVKLKLYQNMVNYRREMSYGYVQTYPLPTPSMVKGMAHSILALEKYHNLKISIQGVYDTVITNMQSVYKFDSSADAVYPSSTKIESMEKKFKKLENKYEDTNTLNEDIDFIKSCYQIEKGLYEIKLDLDESNYKRLFNILFKIYPSKQKRRLSAPKLKIGSDKFNATLTKGNMFVDLIVNMNLVLHIQFDDEELNKRLLEEIQRQAVILGRNEDIARVDEVKMVEYEVQKRFSDINNNIYFSKEFAKANDKISGVHYKLPFYYKEVKSFQDKRIFKFVDAVYVIKPKIENVKVKKGNILVDNDNDIISFLEVHMNV